MIETPNISDGESEKRQALIFAREFAGDKTHEPSDAESVMAANVFKEAFDKTMKNNLDYLDTYEIMELGIESTLDLESRVSDEYGYRAHLRRAGGEQEITIQEMIGGSTQKQLGLSHRYYIDNASNDVLRRYDRDFSTDLSRAEMLMSKQAIEEAGIYGIDEILKQDIANSKFEQEMGLNRQKVDLNEVSGIVTILEKSLPRGH